jgi:deoxyribonuclease-2
MMKVPKITGNTIPNVAAGLAYLYLDANTTYSLSPKSLQQNQDAAANTLSQLYGHGTNSMGWLIYNDEGSSGPTCSYCGHTKGVLGFDANGAFWLIHSVPKYPPAVNGGGSYSYPDSGTE